ncbi:MAG: hypothetical protein AUI09_01350 [Gemmatimonadetes bacterium 13_2_20CM_2_66_5]|nr:MAG: hypothetical protein AUI09_01350 [Gemmatimonadetes bacterium 13_2_20CM_2_66_5]
MFLPAFFLLQATFHSPRVIESSGVAVSHAYPGVLWTHNDSGDGPYLYATDLRGTDRGALLVPGAQAIDWEDIGLGPCPVSFLPKAGSCLYLADTGDNLEFRPFVTVYAIPEPPPPERAGDTLGTTRAPALVRLRYPDGPHDVEALYVSPRDTALYLVSKGARHRGGHPTGRSPRCVAHLLGDLPVLSGSWWPPVARSRARLQHRGARDRR